LLIFTAGRAGPAARARGPEAEPSEALAILTAEILEGIRDGRSVSDLMAGRLGICGARTSWRGCPEMIDEVQVEGTFPDAPSSSPSTVPSADPWASSSTPWRPPRRARRAARWPLCLRAPSDSGRVAGLLPPLLPATAATYWQGVFRELESGSRVLLAARGADGASWAAPSWSWPCARTAGTGRRWPR